MQRHLYCIVTHLCIVSMHIALYSDAIWFYDHKTEIKAYLLT